MNIGTTLTEKILYTNRQGNSLVQKLHLSNGNWHLVVKDVLGHYDHNATRIDAMVAEARRNGIYVKDHVTRLSTTQNGVPNPWGNKSTGHFVNPINHILGK